LADAAFSFTVSESDNGRQTGTVDYATGSLAQTREPRGDMLFEATPVGFDATAAPVQAGPVRLFIGKRSDPLPPTPRVSCIGWSTAKRRPPVDRDRPLRRFQHSVIAMEVPIDMLGPGPIGAWITVSLRRDGRLVPMDREGNPSFNPILNANDLKDEFNATDPVDDVKNHLQPLSETLQRHGYPPTRAIAAARTVLPDILHYDRTRPAHYANGRVSTDDVFSARMNLMVHGQATAQPIGPHDDLLSHFRYLGPPNP
jgi:hypothetical protein